LIGGVSAEFKCPDFAEVECPFFDVDNKNPYSRQLSFCRELDGFAVWFQFRRQAAFS